MWPSDHFKVVSVDPHEGYRSAVTNPDPLTGLRSPLAGGRLGSAGHCPRDDGGEPPPVRAVATDGENPSSVPVAPGQAAAHGPPRP